MLLLYRQLLDEKLCSAIEIGIPFSDPIAEGKTIQKSSSIALKNGVTIDNTLKMISEINDQNHSFYDHIFIQV